MLKAWDQESIDLVEPGFISIQQGGRGEMQFGAFSLELDWNLDDTGKAELTFTGFDETDETSGNGRASLTRERLAGQIKFHHGDKSSFVAERRKAAK